MDWKPEIGQRVFAYTLDGQPGFGEYGVILSVRPTGRDSQERWGLGPWLVSIETDDKTFRHLTSDEYAQLRDTP